MFTYIEGFWGRVEVPGEHSEVSARSREGGRSQEEARQGMETRGCMGTRNGNQDLL